MPSCDFALHKQFNFVISLYRQVMTARRKHNKNFVLQMTQMQSCCFSSLTNYSCKLFFFLSSRCPFAVVVSLR